MPTLTNDAKDSLLQRFLQYVQIHTQSDPSSTTVPSTGIQKDLSRLLVQQLVEMGVEDAHLDDKGYVYATIPSNIAQSCPVICFCSHVDTAPDFNGNHVRPIVHTNYDGRDIRLPRGESQVISPAAYPYLQTKIGNTLITASGDTLLGADDKSGVAIIMEMARQMMTTPAWKHGDIKIMFTPDEEIGRGADHADVVGLGAHYGYTLDGGQLGDLEDETFSADSVEIIVHGISVHPGTAKNIMVNALKVASHILAALPANEWSPETTEGVEGFVHPVQISGLAEQCKIQFIVRDFETANLKKHENRLIEIAETVVSKHPGARLEVVVKEQYRNMKEVLKKHPAVIALARKAMEANGLTPRMEPVRGGTDGSRLSFMGLPCANLFTGMQNLHGPHEWIALEDMEASLKTVLTLCELWTEERP